MQTQTKFDTNNTETDNSQSKESSPIRETLFKHCNDGDTGIVFIKTKKNKACKIFVTEGEVEAVAMGRLSAEEAVIELQNQGVQGATYSERFDLPYAEDNTVNSSDTVLKQFGFIPRNPPRTSS